MCVSFSLHIFSEAFIILGTIQRDIIINENTSSNLKHPLFLSDFNENWIFLTDFRKKKTPQEPNFTKIRPMPAR